MSAAVIGRLREVGLLAVVERIARDHHVSVADVCGRSSTRTVTAARHAAWVAIRAMTVLSTTEIGALFGRDHSTVCAGLKKTDTGRAAYIARAALRVI